MLNVMYVGHTAQLSGGEIALSRLLPALREGVRPLVVLAEDGPIVKKLRDLGIEVLIAPMPAATRNVRKERLANPLLALSHVLGTLRYTWRLRRLIADRQVDVVHTNTLKSGLYGCLAARLAGVPSVWHLRDRLSSDYLPRLALVVARLAVVSLPSRVICISGATMDTLPRRWFRLLGRSDAVVPVAIHDVLDADVHRPAPDHMHGRHGFRVGMVGRLAPWKGQLVVLRAFARADLPASARLIIVGSAMFGEDDYASELDRAIETLELHDRVDRLGFVDDVFGALSTFDVLVHASTIPEPFGQVIVEGLAAGLPVVASRGGGPSEILTDGVDGILYQAGDDEALAAILRRLEREPDMREQLGRRGRDRARAFSPSVIGPHVLAVYMGVLANTAKGQA